MGAGRVTLLLMVLALFCGGCQTAAPDDLAVAAGPKTVLVLPFKNLAARYGPYVSVRSPLGNYVMETGEVMAGADEALTRRLVAMLGEVERYTVLPPEAAADVLTASIPESGRTPGELELVLKAGSAVAADLVITGYVYRFRERVGRDYAIKTPASVAFDVFGVAVADGSIIRIGRFDETQQALTENLLSIGKFFKRKGKWITAEEMAAAGFARMRDTLP